MFVAPICAFTFLNSSQSIPNGNHAKVGSKEWKIDEFISHPFTWGFLALGESMPFAERDRTPMQESLRAGDSELFSVGITEVLKRLTRVPRPDTHKPTSFPSGHATAAFSMATSQAQFHPGQAVWWYLGASAIAVSRIRLYRHHVTDILAGAAVGFLATRLELSQPRGILLNPWILNPTRELQLKASENTRSPWTTLIDPALHRYGVAYSVRF